MTAASARRIVLKALEDYELPLLRYALRLMGEEGLARDAVQHAFLRLCSQCQKSPPANVRAWLYAVCRNQAIDQLRRQGRDLPLTAAGEMPSATIGPAAAAEQAELEQHLFRLLEELPAAQREAVHLWSHGWSYREISELTDRREASIRVLVHRALVRIRQHPGVQTFLCEPASMEPSS